MKAHEKKWLGLGAAGAALLLLAQPPSSKPLHPATSPKPPQKGPQTPQKTPAGKDGDVISYIVDPTLGLIVVKTHESPDVEWGTPRLKDDKIPKLRAIRANYGPLIDDVGVEFRIPSTEIEAIIYAESGGSKNAVSPAGAKGLMQVMPFNFPAGTSEAQMFDPRTNVRAGAKLLSAARNKGKDLVQMASWYNAGGKNGEPWTNEAWLAAKRNPAQTTRWGYAAEPSYIDTVVAAYNSAQTLARAS